MGRRGPRPQPVALKIARGNPGQHKLPEEPKLPPASDAAPALTGSALAEWNRLHQVLVDAGVLTVADESTFVTYCRLVGEEDEYQQLIEKVGREAAHQLGYASYLVKIRAQKKQYAAECGVTPSSRSGVKVAPNVRLQRAQQTDANHGKRQKYFGKRGGRRPA